LLGVFEQAIQCQRDRLRRQIIAGNHAQLHEGQRLTLGQSVAALRGLEQVRDEVVLGRFAALLDPLLEKRLHVLRVTREFIVALLSRHRVLYGVRRVCAHHRTGPARERLHHRGVDAQETRHHRGRKWQSELMDELAFVAMDQCVVNELAGNFPRMRFHRGHALGREGLLHQGTHPRVLRRVFPQQRVDLRLFLRTGDRLAACELRGERPKVSENRVAIGPAQESERAKRLLAAEWSLGA
jgi:hypothetical protein